MHIEMQIRFNLSGVYYVTDKESKSVLSLCFICSSKYFSGRDINISCFNFSEV